MRHRPNKMYICPDEPVPAVDAVVERPGEVEVVSEQSRDRLAELFCVCLLYTSDAADEL